MAAAFRHEGSARRLVHRLKYRGLEPAAALLAAGMVERVPDVAEALVPVPRARLRRRQLGVDPAVRLAVALGRLTDLPVTAALGAAWWWPRHAGRDRAARRPAAGVFGTPGRPSFTSRSPWPQGAVLVDDVLTTGATLVAAAAAGPVAGAVTATAAGI